METSFRKAPFDDGESAWDVIVDGAVVGRITRRRQIGRNLVKDPRYSGTGRHVDLWEATVAHVGLSEDEARAVQHEITRPKRTRDTAASHILDAYKRAGVELPRRIER
jgi:hypothetical protein